MNKKIHLSNNEFDAIITISDSKRLGKSEIRISLLNKRSEEVLVSTNAKLVKMEMGAAA